jgi:hypothetical protein
MKHLILFSFILLLSACKPKSVAIPETVLPRAEMVSVLVDMHIADAVAETKAQGGANEKELTEQYYNRIYTLHHINKQQFTDSYKFYTANPALMDNLYQEVLTELSKKNANVSK